MAVGLLCSSGFVEIFRNGIVIKFDPFFLLENSFEVSIYCKGNFKLVLSTMKFHKRILFRHIYPKWSIVHTYS